MSTQKVIRAWKDEEFRNSLSDAEQAQLPENPAGIIELGNMELEEVTGGAMHFPWTCNTSRCGCQ